jgi:hypothetical protein
MLQILTEKMIPLAILGGFSASGNLGFPVSQCVISPIGLTGADRGVAMLLLDLRHLAIGRVVHLRVRLLSRRLRLELAD